MSARETGATLSRDPGAPHLTWELSRNGVRMAPARFTLATAEKWEPVPGWHAYEASSLGRVRSLDRLTHDGQLRGGQILTPQRDRGYLYVQLHDGKRTRRVAVHVLVMLAHCGECPAGMEVLHRNGRRGDCRLVNLRYGTKPQNRADREKHRRQRDRRRQKGTGGFKGNDEIGEGIETDVTSCVVWGVSRFASLRDAS